MDRDVSDALMVRDGKLCYVTVKGGGVIYSVGIIVIFL